MDDQAAHIAEIGEVREELHLRDDRRAGFGTALDAEGHQRPGTLRAVLLRTLVVAVAGQPGIAHPRHLVVAGEELGNGLGVVRMPLHAERQRLAAGEDEERVERRDRRAEVAQAEHAAGDGEGEIAEGLAEHHVVVFRPRCGEHRIAVRRHPVELAAVDDDAADGIAVAADELGHRVEDDVGAVLEGPAEIGRGQRVVDDERHPCPLGDRSDGLDVGDGAAGIGDRLDEDRLGLRADRILEGGDVVDVAPLHRPAEGLERVIELVDRAAIELARGDDLVARLHQRVQRDQLRRMARGHGQRRRAAFQRRDALLQHVAGRVHDARIDVAEGLQAEQRRGMVGVVEDVGRGLVDRRHPGAGGRVGLGAGMDRQRGKTGYAIVTHRLFPSLVRAHGWPPRRYP